MNIKRFDVNYNQPFFKNFIKQLRKSANLTELGTLIDSWDRGDGPRTGFYTDDEINGVAFLRVNNLKEHSIDISDVKYINREVHEKTLKRTQVTSGDLIFAVSGTKDNLGTVSVVPSNIKEANLNSALVRLNINEGLINKTFFCYFFDLNITRLQIEYIGKGAAQNNLNGDEIGEILIPLPPLLIQEKLVEEMERARESRRRKLLEADALLSTLDGWLLETLGITPPPEDDKHKVFAITLGNVKKRFDVAFSSPKFNKLREEIENNKYQAKSVGEVCESMKSGFAAGKQDQADNDIDGVPHLRPLNLSGFGDLSLKGTKYVPKSVIKDEDLCQFGEVLFNNTNSEEWVGKSTVFELETECACSNHMTRLKVNAETSPHYLALLFNALRSIGYLGMLATNFNNQAGINTQTLSSLRLPFPDLPIQEAIAQEANNRKSEARRLKSEAESEWRAAKDWFEAQLLGK